MSRLTGNDAKGLMEAYSAVYAPQELTEEQVWEEVENWVNSLVEEGYDLSEYTWEEMYESYLSEAPLPSGNFQQTRSTGRASSETRNLYRSSSDGKVYRNYNDALAAKNSRDRAARTASANQKMFKAGGGNAAIPQSARSNIRGGGQTIDPAAIERVRQQGFQNIMRQRQQAQARPATPPTRPAAPATRPAAPAPRQQAPARPATTPPAKSTSGTPQPNPTSAPTAPRQKDTSITDMIGRSQVRQGAPINTGSPTSDARAMAARASVGTVTASPSSTPAAKPAGPSLQQSIRNRRLNMSFDPFDVIKGHLLDEGYADTEEAALSIMANMSEEWKKSIIEG